MLITHYNALINLQAFKSSVFNIVNGSGPVLIKPIRILTVVSNEQYIMYRGNLILGQQSYSEKLDTYGPRFGKGLGSLHTIFRRPKSRTK